MLGKRPHRHIISDFGKIHNNHNLPRHIVVGFELVTSSSSSSSSGESTHDHAKTLKKSFFTASADPCRNNISPRSVLRPAHHDHNPDGHGPHRDFHAKKREEAYADDSRVVLDRHNLLRGGLLAEQIYNTTNVDEGLIDDDGYNGYGGDHGSISSPSHHHNHHGIKHNVGNMIVHTWPMMGIEHVNVPGVLVNEDTSPRNPLANTKFGHISASTGDGDTSVHACPTTKHDDKQSDIDEGTRISMGPATRNFENIHKDMRPAHTWPGTIFQAASPPNHRGFETSFSSRTMFLEQCFLCRSSLQGKDIFMYRGDKAFCSMECRHKQIVIDERE